MQRALQWGSGGFPISAPHGLGVSHLRDGLIVAEVGAFSRKQKSQYLDSPMPRRSTHRHFLLDEPDPV